MFSTDFIFRQQENLVDNQKCQAGFRPLCNKILLLHSALVSRIKISPPPSRVNHIHVSNICYLHLTVVRFGHELNWARNIFLLEFCMSFLFLGNIIPIKFDNTFLIYLEHLFVFLSVFVLKSICLRGSAWIHNVITIHQSHELNTK